MVRMVLCRILRALEDLEPEVRGELVYCFRQLGDHILAEAVRLGQWYEPAEAVRLALEAADRDA